MGSLKFIQTSDDKSFGYILMKDFKGKTINLFLTGCLRELLFSFSNLQSSKRSNNFKNKRKNSVERENRNDDVIKNAGTSRSFVKGNDITIRDNRNNAIIGNKDTNTNKNINISNEQMAFPNINIASTVSSSSSVSSFDTFSSTNTDICDNITCVVFDCHLLLETNPIAEMKCKYIRIRSLPVSFHLFYFNLWKYSIFSLIDMHA